MNMKYEISQATTLRPHELELSGIEGANQLAVIHAKPASWLGHEYGYTVPFDMDLMSRGYYIYQPERSPSLA